MIEEKVIRQDERVITEFLESRQKWMWAGKKAVEEKPELKPEPTCSPIGGKCTSCLDYNTCPIRFY